ncbi:MAG: hypothetical protein KC421_29190, partial [Anaerolineales bacterium]|nr:hypothetical protein [Anaerolineales bacterium]
MKDVRTVEVKEFVGQRVRLQGWLYNVRRLGGVNFIILRDGWGTIQAVTEDEVDLEVVANLGVESVIQVEGTAVST